MRAWPDSIRRDVHARQMVHSGRSSIAANQSGAAMVAPPPAAVANSSEAWRRALPRFDSLKALCAQPSWTRYLDAVYGNSLQFPIDLQHFLFFFFSYLPIRPPSRPMLSTALEMPSDDAAAFAASNRVITSTNLHKGRSHLDIYTMWSACAPGLGRGCGKAVVWIYPFYPDGSTERHGADGIADHTRVEVYHCSNGRDGAECK